MVIGGYRGLYMVIGGYTWLLAAILVIHGYVYRIVHCVAGCMTRYLPREKLSPAEAKEVPRAKPEVLPRLPREITFPCSSNLHLVFS